MRNSNVTIEEDGKVIEFDSYEDAEDQGFYMTRERAYTDVQTAAYRLLDRQIESYTAMQMYGML